MNREKVRKIVIWAIIISSIAVVLMFTRCSATRRENKIEIMHNDIEESSEEYNEIEIEDVVRSFETVGIKDGEIEVLSYEITGYENGKKYIKINCLTEESSEADLKAYQGEIELLRSEQRVEKIDKKVEMSFKFELRNTEDKIDLVFEELDRNTLQIIEKSRISFDIKGEKQQVKL